MDTEKWTDKIDSITDNFKQTFGKLSIEQLNWKPNEQIWSIAQNIDHIIVLNETYFPTIDSMQQGTYNAPFIGKAGFMVNFFGKMIFKSVQPDRKRKIKTFHIWEPTSSEVKADLLIRFGNHQANLKERISNCQDLLDKRAVISSPANKNIVYTLEIAFDIILAHEQRHFEQAKETLSKQS
ncbi:MAG: DinB family protein [Balneolales bacterium]